MCCISAHTHNRNSHMRLPDGLGLDHRIGPPHQSKLHFRGWVRLKPACILLSLISTCSVYKPWCDLLKGLFVVKPLLTRANTLGIGPGGLGRELRLFVSLLTVWLYACVLADLPLRDFAHQPGALIFSVLKDAFLGRLAHFWGSQCTARLGSFRTCLRLIIEPRSHLPPAHPGQFSNELARPYSL